ncbi:MAG TPA: M20/M25/M40 family metallo-hydrolase [Xanthobacteraceae bacterium]|nr:M20/M25/M40 family metallo-hydrolase [Xanthobacteraceae bacterium]
MGSADRQKVAAYITPELVRQTLLDMVDIRSPTGHEAAMADYIIDRLRRAGLDTQRQLVEHDRPNAVAHLPGRGDGLNLLFTGHMDTSYSGDEPHLSGEGFRPKGVFRDGWVWGLGANNMKSGLAGLLVAVEAIAKSGIALHGDITLGAVVGEIEKAPAEEFQGRDYSGYGVGTKHLVSHGVTADYALLAEPTGMRICTANMGCLWARITLEGTVAHSALTNKTGTVNAINMARLLCDDIDAWAASFQDANVYLDEHANVTLACIRGGAPWRLSRNPYECSVYLDIRTVPGQTADQVKRELRALLTKFAARHKISKPALHFIVTDPALVINENLPVVTALGEAQQAVMGQKTATFLRRPGSDAVHLSRYDVPCVQFGPGGRLHPDAKGSMHAVGDHVLLDDVVLASRIYFETALNLCEHPIAAGGAHMI